MNISPTDFASLLCSRLCHDLLSPVGALNNGLELLADEQDPEMRARCLELLGESARASANKLKFFRLAFGAAGGFGEMVDAREAQAAIEGLFADNNRVKVGWMVEAPSLPKQAIKVLLNLALIAGDALVRGGQLDIGAEAAEGHVEIVVRADGPRIILDPELRNALSAADQDAPVTPRAAAAFLVRELVRQGGGELQVSPPDAGVLLFGSIDADRLMRWLLALLALLLAPPAFARERSDEVIAIDVLLLPDAATAEKAQAMNARLRARNSQAYPLDATHAPHITLVQRFIRRGDLPKVMAALEGVLRTRPDWLGTQLRATGYTASQFGGGGLLLLDVERTENLDLLQQMTVNAVQPHAVPKGGQEAFVRDPGETIVQGTIDWVETFVPNASGDKFAPHITIGSGPYDFLKGIAAEPFAPFVFKPSALAIYQLGNYGTARRLLWTSAKPPLIAR